MSAPESRGDLAAACGLFAAATGFALVYLSGAQFSHFYQEDFGPAVALACRGEFVPLQTSSAAFADFLSRKTASLACADLGAAVALPFDIWQHQHLYLLLAAGVVWSITGVEWHALSVLAALMAGGFAVAVYAVGRAFLPVSWAAAVSAAAILSPYSIRMMPELRDYGKAPFIIAAIWFGCRLAVTEARLGRALVAGAVAGIVTGTGLGFRPDLTSTIPFLLLAWLLSIAFRAGARRAVLAAGAAFALTFAVTSAPILGAYRSGGVLGFAALNGLTTPFAAELGLSAPPYDIGHLFLDSYIHAFVHAYAAKFQAPAVWPDYATDYPGYGGYSVRGFVEYARHFPADMVIRACASILKVLSVHTRDVALTPLNPGLLLLLLALAVVAVEAPVLSVVLGLAAAYFCGLGALQFHSRHLFHLELFSWLAAAIVARAALRLHRREASLAEFGKGIWVPVAALAGAVVLVAGLRIYQQHEAAWLFDSYLRAERLPVSFTEQARGDAVLLVVSDPVPDVTGAVTRINETEPRAYNLAAVLDERRCPNQIVGLKVSYEKAGEDFSRDLPVALDHGAEAHVFFLVFADVVHRFSGIEIAREQRRCLKALEAVTGYKSLPLPLWLRLPSTWREQRLYQTIAN